MKKSIKDAVSFAARRAFRPRKHDISYVLANASACRTPADRVAWLESLVAWVRSSSPPAAAALGPSASPSVFVPEETNFSQVKTQAGVRVRFVLHLVERNPEWRAEAGATLARLAAEVPATELFCEVGIFSGQGLFGQIASILIDRFLPIRSGTGDLDQLVTALFPAESDAAWVESLAEGNIARILSLIEGERGRPVWNTMHRSFADAMLIMASQVAGAGMEREMRGRVPIGDVATSVFFRLFGAVQQLHPRLQRTEWVGTEDRRDLNELQDVIRECLTVMERAFAYLEIHGVSVDLVFRFERTELLLRRLLLMSEFLGAAAQGSPEAGLGRLLAALIRTSHDAHRLSRLFSGKIRLLSRRIVEHTGDSGEHYIVHDRAGYLQLLVSAGGGGLLTVGTTIIKAAIARFPLPPMLGLLANAGNYAGSFLAMNFCHFTLATKQPSMTASTLARKLSEFARGTDSQEIIATIRDAFRSQFAAAIGNVGVAIPAAALVTWLYQHLTGKEVFSQAYAHKTLMSLDPLTTMTVPFAIFTGVLLWVASLLSGMAENWVALRQVPQRLESSSYLRFWLGPVKTTRMVLLFTKHLPGAAGSVVLGTLLALTPFFGAMSGIPLDVRHVTLSSSALTIAAVSLRDSTDADTILRAVAGVGLTGVMNFGVSFFLALVVASRAQNVRRGLLGLVSQRVFRTFLRAPREFFWPNAGQS